ncbi:hypothetical protein LZ496_12200 [Sphingomonas sp. NSE70-1]|uniref:PRTase-CE domain-containing protein n=1 Tax=Sphingomonas caseinilyticus TaxID=2908205 RepID=A0ABT0RWY9_9SPHN|nr:hypothetical protein [Sphingomonas caseinilyticus]MCL6699543.1 hypothetical protein [Sphingomonas caseinilyticus]
MNDAAQARTREEEWAERFRFYIEPPTVGAIKAWLELFEEADRPTAAKALDHVLIISEREIQRGYRAALETIPGWSADPAVRQGSWFFVGFGRAGESGPAMVRSFRSANDLALAKYDGLFCDLSDLPYKKLTASDTVVFIDDFSGTGRQVCRLWPVVSELVASEAVCHLILTAATTAAETAIRERTQLISHVSHSLGPDANVFDEACTNFDQAEKDTLARYGAIADPRRPRGYGDSGLLLVLSHKTPNNSIPILHVNEDHWKGLFPRYLRAA